MQVFYILLIVFAYGFAICPESLNMITFTNDLSAQYNLEVNMTVSKEIDPESIRLKQQTLTWRIENGENLTFYVSFPYRHTLPRLIAVTLNGKRYCTDSPDEQNVIVLSRKLTIIVPFVNAFVSDLEPLPPAFQGNLEFITKSRSEAVARAQAKGIELANARLDVVAQAMVYAQAQANVVALAKIRSQVTFQSEALKQILNYAQPGTNTTSPLDMDKVTRINVQHQASLAEIQILIGVENSLRSLAQSESVILTQAKDRVRALARSEATARAHVETLAGAIDRYESRGRYLSMLESQKFNKSYMTNILSTNPNVNDDKGVILKPGATIPNRTVQISTYLNECGINDDFQPFIIAGNSTKEGDYPWLVALLIYRNSQYNFECGGNLISNNHVLTAAHCVRIKGFVVNNVLIVMGSRSLKDWSEYATTRTVASYAVHNDYKRPADADIALLTLNQPVEFLPAVKPICLWSESDNLELIVGQSGVVAGWGRDEVEPLYLTEHKQLNMPIVSHTNCLWSNPGFYYLTSDRTFCAGERKGSTPCTGDSGGGLFLKRNNKWTLRGIVSVGLPGDRFGVCSGSHYTVFSDVSKFYDWIIEQMRNPDA